MQSKVSGPVLVLLVAVFVIGGLAGYVAGTSHAAQVAATAAPTTPPGGGCAMGSHAGKGEADACSMTAGTKGAGKGEAPACPMTGGKAKPATECPEGGEKGKCAKHPSCPDAGKCPDAGAKADACGMHVGEGKPNATKPGACPMGAGKAPATKSAVKTPAKDVAAAKATYLCTMCPDVKSDKAGSCPKCGMALQKK